MTTLRLISPVAIAASNDKPRKLFITGYTGGIMSLTGFGAVAVDLAGLELPASLPILADHENRLDAVVGTGKPATDGRTLTVAATLADTSAAQTVLGLLASGVVLQASLGADPIERRPISAGEELAVNGRTLAGPFTLIVKSLLREMTITALGADSSTSVLLARGSTMKFKSMLRAAKASGDEAATKYSDDEIDKMTEDDAKAALKKCMADATADDEADKTEPPASARALVSIMSGTPPTMQARAANEGWGIQRCKDEALQFLRGSRASGHAGNYGGSGSGGSVTDTDTVAALVMRAGGESLALKAYGERTVQSLRSAGMDRMSFSDLFAGHLRASGIDPGPRHDIEGMLRASGGASNASLGNLLSNSLNKLLELQWPQAPGTWRSWCALRPVKDFKPAKSLRPVFNQGLSPLGNAGEIAHGDLSDNLISYQLSTFAKMFTISRATLINDDLSALQELPLGLALMADRSVSDLVYYNLLANTGTQFSSGNANTQSGAGSALSAASLTTAIKKMRLQVGPNSAPLNIAPATLVVGPDLEQTAKELLHSSFQFRDQTSDRQQAGNPLAQAVELQVEPRLSLGARNPIDNVLSAGVAAQWFVFAKPTYLPGIVGFLNGNESPQVQSADPMGFNFDTPGQSWRCLFDFGFSLGDFRAAQRSVGS